MASNKYKQRDLDLQRLTDKKGKELSKFLGINSAPNTQLIANIQTRINNPLFKLSVNDYKVICGNRMMINMMSKVIKCDSKQLKKFCKYINVFIENIESSPKSIKNKMIATQSINASKIRGSLNLLPDDIYYPIVNKYKTIFKVKYVLKDWIPLNELKKEILSENPNAIDYLKENRNLIDWAALLRNPNPEAIAFFIENKNNIPNYYDLLFNNISSATYNRAITNPAAIEYIKDVLNRYPDNIEWHLLSINPAAIELLKQKIREEALNPDVVEDVHDPFFGTLILQTHYSKKIDWWALSQNPNAIELLKANRNKIDWSGLSANTNLKAIELLKTNPTKIDWDMVSANPNAIELLKANPNKIVWYYLSGNPNPEAIKLLRANPYNIDWRGLCSNPCPDAIELLKENRDKIDWYQLSNNPNPNAVELLKNFEHRTRINWEILNANPSIFEAVLE